MKWMKRLVLAAVAVGCMMIMNPQAVQADVTCITLQDYIHDPATDPASKTHKLDLNNNTNDRDLPTVENEPWYYEQFGTNKGVSENGIPGEKDPSSYC